MIVAQRSIREASRFRLLLLASTAPRWCAYSTVTTGAASTTTPIERVRNVGIVAHVDAGKTTLTERLLFLAGEVKRMGEVDAGTTVTDFLEVERERGITVQSAVVSLQWRGHRIHLIDTPGHVDFGVEVQRCVRVLDGLLVVLDASAGVQAQTLTVWRQAARRSLPTVFLINKMDKPQANFAATLSSIEDKLRVKPLPVVVPVSTPDGTGYSGFVDVIAAAHLPIVTTAASANSNVEWTPIQAGSREADVAAEQRETLCLGLADADETFARHFLEEHDGVVQRVQNEALREALTRASLSRTAAAVACGTALRSAVSIRPCLDAMVDLLPSPLPSSQALHELLDDRFGALVFKIAHDRRKGRLAYARVYSGALRSGAHVWNWTRQWREGPVEVFEPQSDVLEPVREATAGSIVVLRGLADSLTGHTLLARECENVRAPTGVEDEEEGAAAHLIFEGIEHPDTVFYCSIEPPSVKYRHALEKALAELVAEDPSLRVRVDRESGQTILETMGELHVEIVKHRLVHDYGLNVFLGPLQVGYREVIEDTIEELATIEDAVDGRTFSATVALRIEPAPGAGAWRRLKMGLPPGARPPRSDWLLGVREALSSSLRHGPILGFPVHDVDVYLCELTTSGNRVGTNLVCGAAHKCVEAALRRAAARLVEPVMEVEIRLPVECSSQPVLHELTRRRAVIQHVEGGNEHDAVIRASLPLSSLMGLSTAIRTVARGMAELHVRTNGHQLVDPAEQARMIREKSGVR